MSFQASCKIVQRFLVFTGPNHFGARYFYMLEPELEPKTLYALSWSQKFGFRVHSPGYARSAVERECVDVVSCVFLSSTFYALWGQHSLRSIRPQAQWRQKLPDLGEWGGPHENNFNGKGRKHARRVRKVLRRIAEGEEDRFAPESLELAWPTSCREVVFVDLISDVLFRTSGWNWDKEQRTRIYVERAPRVHFDLSIKPRNRIARRWLFPTSYWFIGF